MQITLLAATAVLALANWWSRVINSERIERWAKPLTTMLVIGLALANESPTGRVATAVIALIFCLWGDIALMAPIDNFVLGLASFLIGHVVFIVLFAQYGMPHVAFGAAALALMAVLAATVGRRIVNGAAAKDPALRIPVVAYLVVISAMTVCGWATGRGWVVAGATLFVISDSLLGWRAFVRERSWMSVAVMVTYHGAIVSLALSLW
ncbi:MAG TPA: lysoplasmalogenase [Ilumatobacteraceae bacterium]|mgnify:CR=1 FL=1|nr:lysoplasmalogenase [Ilumatobacteraceae bacterium]HRB02346.1 lysoplasmalogenase [Ilumatobacteraceae bacterium]